MDKIQDYIKYKFIDGRRLNRLLAKVYRYILLNDISIRVSTARIHQATEDICNEFREDPDFTADNNFAMATSLSDRKMYNETILLMLVSARLYSSSASEDEGRCEGITDCCKHIALSFIEIYGNSKSRGRRLSSKVMELMEGLRRSVAGLKSTPNVKRVCGQGKCLYWSALTLFELGDDESFKDKLLEGFDLLDEQLTEAEQMCEIYQDLFLWNSLFKVVEITVF